MNQITPIALAFDQLGLNPKLLQALPQEGYTDPTPIQAQAIPHLLAGRDLLGLAQTGTGKTAAFLLPILHRLAANRRAARAAHRQRADPGPHARARLADRPEHRRLRRPLGMTHTVVFGGVSQFHQVNAMRRGVDFLVATPGRLLDLVSQGHIDLRRPACWCWTRPTTCSTWASSSPSGRRWRMLPRERQTLLFSATMPTAIAPLAGGLLRDPARVEVTPPGHHR